MKSGDKFSRFLVLELGKIENSATDPETKRLLKQLMEDLVRFLDESGV